MINAFLLTRDWHETPSGITLEFWCQTDNGPIYLEIQNQEAVFFVRNIDLSVIDTILHRTKFRAGTKHFNNFRNETTIALYFLSYRQARTANAKLWKKNIPTWEADIRPTDRYLMERFINGGLTIEHSTPPEAPPTTITNPKLRPNEFRPTLKSISIDIETTMDATKLYSIAVFNNELACAFLVSNPYWALPPTIDALPSNQNGTRIFNTEKQCIEAFLDWLQNYDPDILLGWNVIQFDLRVLETLCQKHSIKLTLGRANKNVTWREDAKNKRFYINIPGRFALDGIEILRSASLTFNSFKLNDVAKKVLGDEKLLQGSHLGQAITELYNNAPAELVKYNLHDCKLVWDIFEQEQLLEFSIARSQLTGLPLDKMGGSVAAFEFAYLPQLHRKGYIAPNLGELKSTIISPGGYVLDSQPGIYKNVLVLDFKSLYPSIIRTFFIDPYGFWVTNNTKVKPINILMGYNGASFSKDDHILPNIIAELWLARDAAKRNKNLPLSQAIKIIMNSFYGVLGSTGCRFFDPRICSSITLRGHDILKQTRSWIENRDYHVIYGDTDSVFVWIGNDHSEQEALAIGKNLASALNRNWRETLKAEYNIESALEIEFDTHYLKFIMPTIRNSTLGSKKRYAGIVHINNTESLIFKGLENVRTDWTPLAQEFQNSLYQLVFNNKDVEAFIRQTTNELLAGKYFEELIYRKRLRRNLVEYQKNIPPHVQAALKLEKKGIKTAKGDWINYVLTNQGPEPIIETPSGAVFEGSINYASYVERQIKPIADGVLQFIDLRFDEITASQMSLFN